MNRFATLQEGERREFFIRYQQTSGVQPAVVEKDFWVCWLLGLIFQTPELGGNALFKGGTSLSKVFNVINRFSEDIDLGISPASLGFPEDGLDNAPSKTVREKRIAALNAKCARDVEHRFMPVLEKIIRGQLGAKAGAPAWLRYELDAPSHSPVVYFDYPATPIGRLAYIKPSVKIEFGALTDQRPTGRHPIVPFIAALVPDVFVDFRVEVVALEIERTFWEKATILHAEFHRPAEKPIPARYARHYSDFAALWNHPLGAKCARHLDLLERVCVHKNRFFKNAWSRYETARPGTLRLLPPETRHGELRRDYALMLQMFMNAPPPFEDILQTLIAAETSINRSQPSANK